MPKRASKQSGARRPGRPTKLTPELQRAICAHLEIGAGLKVAAEAEGITETTALAWQQRGRAAIAAEERGETVPETELAYQEFAGAVARARSAFELTCLRRLQSLDSLEEPRAAGALGQAIMKLLERTRRETYGSHITVKVEEAKEVFLDVLERVCGRLGAAEVLREVLQELARGGDSETSEAPGAEPVH